MSGSLDYASSMTPSSPGRRRVARGAAVAAAVVLAANVLLLAVAYHDRSWGALGIAMMIGPITNGVLAVVGLGCLPALKRRAGGAPTAIYLLASVALPLLAIPADFFAVGAMDLHGC